MMEPDYFAELFALAQESLVRPRERFVLELRYGFGGGEPHTLKEVGQQLGVSRERARQLVNKAHQKIVRRGMTQIRYSKHDGECAELILSVRKAVNPEADGAAERLVEFAEDVIPYLATSTHALPLIATLAFSKRSVSKSVVAEARQLIRQRRPGRRKREKASERLRGLLLDVLWPAQSRLLAETEWGAITRAREVSLVGAGNAGSFYSGKLKRDVQYESMLEHDFLLCLERVEEVVFYQEQPLVIPYAIGDQKRSYYPDVLIVLEDKRGVIAEIKPVFQMALEQNLIKWGALQKFCAQEGFGLLITDGRRCIEQVRRHRIKPEFEKAVLLALQDGPLSWAGYRSIKNHFKPGRDDFVALVLRHRLMWHLNPFTLHLP